MRRLTAAICTPLLTWYKHSARNLPWRENRDPYQIWVSEIMLQQTRVEAVKAYFTHFMQTCPTVQAFAETEEQTYLKLWEGLGYYNRVRNMHRAACMVCSEYGGTMPRTYAELRTLPGIGAYTAGAIASIAYGERVPAVDGNVLRVIARLVADERSITTLKVQKEIREQVAAILPEDVSSFNQALMELGALVCVPNGSPHCGECPVASECAAARLGIAATLPKKAPKKTRTQIKRTVFLLRMEQAIILQRRPEKGLLAGLWELPGVEQPLQPEQAHAYLQGQGWHVAQMRLMQPAKHIFTHVEWHMIGYYVELEAGALPEGAILATPTQLHSEYTLPSAFRPFLSVLEDA